MPGRPGSESRPWQGLVASHVGLREFPSRVEDTVPIEMLCLQLHILVAFGNPTASDRVRNDDAMDIQGAVYKACESCLKRLEGPSRAHPNDAPREPIELYNFS